MRRTMRIAGVSGVVMLLGITTSSGHHSFAGGGFDGTKAVHLKGKIVSIDWVNPHSWIHLDAAGPAGQPERWALEGPSATQLRRMNVDLAAFKPGDVLQACGYGTREGSEVTSGEAPRPTPRKMSAELLTLASGEALVWSNYGQRKCLDETR